MAKARSTTGSTKTRKPAAATKAPSKARKKTATASASPSMAASSTSSKTNDSVAKVSAEDRQRMIQDAAYHIAEKDGFQAGREQEYWYRAEKQIDQLIQGQRVLATGSQQADTVDTDIH